MKPIIFSIVISALFGSSLFAQYDLENQGKYQYYKERFQNNYIRSGKGFGKSIPFSQRVWKNGDEKTHQLEGGEHTLMLGNYIAFLGTEYKLYKESNLSTQGTLRELYYALEAFNRLDYYAETYETDPSNLPPNLNGFFVREDVPDGFLSANSALNSGAIAPDTLTGYGYVKQSGRPIRVNKHGDEVAREEGKPIYSHMSQDHAIRILWGLMLAYRCLDDKVSYYENGSLSDLRSFQDGEHDFKKEIRNIFLRIVDYLKIHETSLNQWYIVKPNGEKVEAGAWVGYKREIDFAYQIMKNEFNYSARPPRNTWTGIGTQFGMNDWMNGRMQLEAQNLGNNPYAVWKRSTKLGYESYFLYYGMIVHNWSFSSKKLNQLKEATAFYLNTAPCEGPFYHNDTDYAPFGWASPDRTERAFENTYFGTSHVPGNYNGLDYLLMHNFYYLNHFDELGPFNPNQSTPCTDNCNNVDKKVMDQELSRVKKRVKKHCKRSCKREKKDCKKAAKDTKRACISTCNQRRGRARRQCRRGCRQTKRATKRNCRQTKRVCKKECKILNNEYGKKIEEMKRYCD